MSVKETVREVMNAKGFTNALLAEKCGYNTPSGVSTKFERKSMNVDTLMKFLAAMDCELIIRSRTADKSEWKLTNE